jgi:hypothetical protein
MPTDAYRQMTKRRLWRFCYWSGVIILFGTAAWNRFTLPLDPIADPDTWGYLSPALRKLTGAPFGHTSGRNFIYPGFVYLLLGVFRDFRAITVAQHLLGLVAGGMLLLTWHRVRVFVAHPRVPAGFYYMIGLVAAATFLLASEPLHFEMQLRPEGVSAFLFSINLYVLAQFTSCWVIEHRNAATAVYGAAGVFISVLLGSVKPSFVLVSFLAVLPMVVLFFQKNRLWQKVVIAAGALASVLLLWVPEHLLSRGDQISQTFLPTTLFVIHANLIRDQMADDLERNTKLPYSHERLRRIHAMLSTELSKSGTRYKTLGFDPDYLMYNRTSFAAQLRKEFGDDISALNGFYRFYYLRIWQQRPGAVFEKIVRQLAIFYGPKCGAYKSAKIAPLAEEYRRGVASLSSEWYRETWTVYPPALQFMDRTQLLSASSPVLRQPAYIDNLLDILARAYLPMILGAFGLGVVLLFHQHLRSLLGCLTAWVLFVYSYGLASCLEVATIQTLQIARYMTVQMYFAILAQFLAFWLILEVVLELLPHARITCSDPRVE